MARKSRGPRERALMVITLLVVLGGGGYQFIFLPLQQMYLELQQQVDLERDAAELDRTTYANLERITREYDRRRKTLDMPGSEAEQEIQVLSQINEIFDRNKVAPFSHDAPEVRQIEGFKIFSYQFKGIVCSIFDLAQLLEDIRSSDAVLEVSKVGIERRGGTRGANWPAEQVIVTMTISRLVNAPDDGRADRRSILRSRRPGL